MYIVWKMIVISTCSDVSHIGLCRGMFICTGDDFSLTHNKLLTQMQFNSKLLSVADQLQTVLSWE